MQEATAIKQNKAVAIGAIALVILALGGAGWFAWNSLFGGPKTSDLIEAGPGGPRVQRANAGGGGGNPLRDMFRTGPAADGVRKMGDAYLTRSGTAQLRAVKDKNGAWTVTPSYLSPGPATAEQRSLFSAKLNSLFLKLTDEQSAKLDAIPQTPLMVVSEGDKDALLRLWVAWDKAPEAGKKEAEAALMKSISEIGTKAEEPTKAALAARAEKIRQVLTKEQLDKLLARSR